MHPEIRKGRPGNCPKCGMDQIRVECSQCGECEIAERLGAALARAGYAVITGGGPGVSCASGCIRSYNACFSAGGSGGLSAAIVRPAALVEIGA